MNLNLKKNNNNNKYIPKIESIPNSLSSSLNFPLSINIIIAAAVIGLDTEPTLKIIKLCVFLSNCKLNMYHKIRASRWYHKIYCFMHFSLLSYLHILNYLNWWFGVTGSCFLISAYPNPEISRLFYFKIFIFCLFVFFFEKLSIGDPCGGVRRLVFTALDIFFQFFRMVMFYESITVAKMRKTETHENRNQKLFECFP